MKVIFYRAFHDLLYMAQFVLNGQIITLPVDVGKTYRGRPLEPNEIYIGRPSKWGNPFKIGEHGTREEVCLRYYNWIFTQPHLLAELPKLKGRRLMCYCTPQLCHGHMLGLAILKYEGTSPN